MLTAFIFIVYNFYASATEHPGFSQERVSVSNESVVFAERTMTLNSNRDLNLTYKSDIKYTINSCRTIALILGLWPIDFLDSPIQKIIKLIINFSSCFLMTFVLMSSILFGIYELKDLDQKVGLTGPISFWIMSLAKYLLILFRGAAVKKCFKYIEDDWREVENAQHRNFMMKNASFGRYITIASGSFMYIGGFWYHVVRPLMADTVITEMNVTIKPFPSPAYGKFFTSGYSPIYEIVYGTQLIAGFFLYSATVAAFSFAAVLTMHACGRFEIVILYLKDVVNEIKGKKDSMQERLIVTVNAHLRVLSFVSQLEALLTEICLIEVMGCTLNLCLLGYYFIMGWKQADLAAIITYSILFVSFIFNIFIYCYIGELLTIQARKVGEHAYLIDWYRLPKSKSLDLLFLIRISQYPATITAGKFIVLSLRTFSTVIRSSAAYFNALWKMSQ